MRTKILFIAGAAACGMCVASPAAAQVAAETGAILSGTGQGTGAAARTMGNAVRGSVGSAANAVNAVNSARSGSGAARSRYAPQGNSTGGRAVGYWIPAGVDPLQGYDVPTYRLANGSVLKITGRLDATPTTDCIRHCPV